MRLWAAILRWDVVSHPLIVSFTLALRKLWPSSGTPQSSYYDWVYSFIVSHRRSSREYVLHSYRRLYRSLHVTFAAPVTSHYTPFWLSLVTSIPSSFNLGVLPSFSQPLTILKPLMSQPFQNLLSHFFFQHSLCLLYLACVSSILITPRFRSISQGWYYRSIYWKKSSSVAYHIFNKNIAWEKV